MRTSRCPVPPPAGGQGRVGERQVVLPRPGELSAHLCLHQVVAVQSGEQALEIQLQLAFGATRVDLPPVVVDDPMDTRDKRLMDLAHELKGADHPSARGKVEIVRLVQGHQRLEHVGEPVARGGVRFLEGLRPEGSYLGTPFLATQGRVPERSGERVSAVRDHTAPPSSRLAGHGRRCEKHRDEDVLVARLPVPLHPQRREGRTVWSLIDRRSVSGRIQDQLFADPLQAIACPVGQ